MGGIFLMEPQKTKLYAAVSMRGKTRAEIMDCLRGAAIDAGYNPDDCEFINLLPEDVAANKTPVECLGLSIVNLAHADHVIIGKPGTGTGVSCEEYICNKYRIPYTKVGFEN